MEQLNELDVLLMPLDSLAEELDTTWQHKPVVQANLALAIKLRADFRNRVKNWVVINENEQQALIDVCRTIGYKVKFTYGYAPNIHLLKETPK